MKSILRLILPQVGRRGLVKYIVLGLLSGLCNFLIINSVTRIVALITANRYTSVRKDYVLLFFVLILFFVLVRRTLAVAIIKLAQMIFWDLRKRILTLVLRSNYQQFCSNRIEVHAAIVSDVSVLTNVSVSIIDFCTSSILAVSSLIYLSSISPVLFLITLAVTATGVLVYHFRSKKNERDFQKARILETEFQQHVNGILGGFKEIFIEPAKGRFIFDQKIEKISDQSYANNTKAFTGYLNNQITGQVLFYILIFSVLLFFSVLLEIKTNSTVSFVFTLLYLLSSTETIMALLPGLARARVASNHLMALKDELERENFGDPGLQERFFPGGVFESLRIDNLEFSYERTEEKFRIGPVSLEVNRGEVIFIYGGNGSGKTTLVYTLLGLYIPTAGEVKLNGLPIDSSNYNYYRSIFSVVFSDFYLFEEIPGSGEIDLEKWKHYLTLFELDEKVALEGRRLSSVDLSTGQRKRLALIVALLEEKPVLVMDEWAADQDPYFRRKFYTEIIPLLKGEGVAIIAITHDDKYYYCADKLFKMDFGKLISEHIPITEANGARRVLSNQSIPGIL